MIIKAIKLEGTSMLPLFKEGEVVFISPFILHPSPSHPFRTARPACPPCELPRSARVGQSRRDVGVSPTLILHPGDCVVYNIEGKKLLHRIMKTKNNGVWISDDAGIIEPHFIQWANIKGKVISKNPFTSGLTGLIYSKIRKMITRITRNIGLLTHV